MLDVNGIEIKVGMTVKTQQLSGGIFSPAEPEIGIVQSCFDAFDRSSLQIKFSKNGSWRYILLEGKINEVISH
jgi:hypothetical protein